MTEDLSKLDKVLTGIENIQKDINSLKKEVSSLQSDRAVATQQREQILGLVAKHEGTLYGNGQAGMITRITVIDRQVKELEVNLIENTQILKGGGDKEGLIDQVRDIREGVDRLKTLFWGAVTTIVGAIITFYVSRILGQ